MKILGLDTTGDVCSVGIMDGDKLIAHISLHDKNTHSVNLMPLVDKALALGELNTKDIEAYAVNVGPGSFTGIRIGVCTVMGLALAENTPCIAVNTLESLAYNAVGYTGYICPMIDARRTESYYALFKADGVGIERVKKDDADKLEVFLKQLPEEEICFVGDGAVHYREVVEEIMGKRAVFLPESDMFPSAVSVLKVAKIRAMQDDFTTAYDLKPYYFRASQAEQMKAK